MLFGIILAAQRLFCTTREGNTSWLAVCRSEKCKQQGQPIYTHNTVCLFAANSSMSSYRGKMHNSTPGGEINTIQTGLKNLDQVIRLGPSFACGAPRRPSGKRRPSPDNLSRLSYPVSIVYVSPYFTASIRPCALRVSF